MMTYWNRDTSVVSPFLHNGLLHQIELITMLGTCCFTCTFGHGQQLNQEDDHEEQEVAVYSRLPVLHGFDILIHLLLEETRVDHTQLLTLEYQNGPLQRVLPDGQQFCA